MAYKPSGYKIKHLTGLRTNKLRPIKKRGGEGKFIFRKKKIPQILNLKLNKDLIIEKNLISTYI